MKNLKTKLIICLTITSIGVLIATLPLTGCGVEQNLFSDIGPEWLPDGAKIAYVEPTYYKLETNWALSGS